MIWRQEALYIPIWIRNCTQGACTQPSD